MKDHGFSLISKSVIEIGSKFMSFSIHTKKDDGKYFRNRAFLLAAAIVVSTVPVRGYADGSLSAANSQAQAGSVSSVTLFPEVVGTPWVQQLNGLQQKRQNWVHISEQSPESVSDADKKQTNVPGLINSAAGEVDGSDPFPVEQISGVFRRGSATISQAECFEQEPCVHQSGQVSSEFIQTCSDCRGRNSKYPLNEELAPAQRLSRQPWRSPIGVAPWIDVFQAENSASVTFFGNKRSKENDVHHRALQGNLNSKLLADDRPVTQMSLNVQPEPGRMPEQRGLSSDSNLSATGKYSAEIDRGWRDCLVHWNASEASHGPLYFEEANLERHGYSRGYWQPVFSGVRFFSTAPLLPGLMTLDRPFSLQYELGESRVGSSTPYRARKIPWDAKSVLVEIAVVSGISFIIP